MSATLTWFGWSTFRLDVADGPSIVFDPCVSPLLDDRHATLSDLEGVDLFVLTHGHHEHIKDVPRVAAAFPGVPFVAPAQVREYLVGIKKIPRDRITLAQPGQPLLSEGLRLVPHHFPHLPKHEFAGKVANLRRDNPLRAPWLLARYAPRILRAWLQIREQPEFGPFLAYDVEVTGLRLLFTCEAFTELLDPREVVRWRGDRPVDVAVIGVESGQEEAAGRLCAALDPLLAIACPVHATFERFYGKPPVELDRWAEGRADRIGWRPGDSTRLDVGR